jgi:hypothetical protein
MKLYTCSTHYDTSPPTDINPLILQLHEDGKILVLCAREGMVTRIRNRIKEPGYLNAFQEVDCYGWWDLTPENYDQIVGSKALLSYTAVILIGPERIDPSYKSLVDTVLAEVKSIL